MGNVLVHRRRMACVALGLSLILIAIVILSGYSPTLVMKSY
jgi:hypothetical protein